MNSLPSSIREVDLRPWDNTRPEDFFLKPYLKTDIPDYHRADKLLRYSRLGPDLSYDHLAFRIVSATPFIRAAQLQSIPSARFKQQLGTTNKTDEVFDSLAAQEVYLAHRPIEMFSDGRASYKIIDTFFKVWNKDHRGFEDIAWIFPLSTMPKAFLDQASDDDLPTAITQHYRISSPEFYWLPLTGLLEAGFLNRMQDWKQLLVNETLPGHFYCFISHRWLTPVHPDPEGIQARLIAWQIISYLCEAIRIAKERGLSNPRKFNASFGVAMGIAGSDLAESILVNVLRYHLDEELLQEAFKEMATLPLLEEDYGIAQARDDHRLLRLKDLLAGRPVLKMLTGKIHIWYDYSCMPQRPFTGDDELVFRKNIERLNLLQYIGQTLILLEDVDDYLSRAWCTLESVFADNQTGYNWFTLAGSLRDTNKDGRTEQHFYELLQDRPHLIWRAMLDTELFKAQTLHECMERLGLSTTEPNDLPLIYGKLKALKMPVKIHVDDSEVITGVLPLPVVEKDNMLLARETGRALSLSGEDNIEKMLSVDWTSMLNLADSLDAYKENFAFFPDGFMEYTQKPDPGKLPSAHICVIGSCEGESMLISNWVHARLAELEQLLGLRVRSLSWVSSDIAPVGQFVNGRLKVKAIDCHSHILVGSQMRLINCNTSNFIMNSLRGAGKQLIHIQYDSTQENVIVYKTPKMPADRSNYDVISVFDEIVHNGGLFRWALPKYLMDKKH